MKKRIVAILLCMVMLLSITAMAEEAPAEVPAEVPATETVEATKITLPELAEDTVVVTIGGKTFTWKQVMPVYDAIVAQYAASYDVAEAQNVQIFRTLALDEFIVQTVLDNKTKEFGFDILSDEEVEKIKVEATNTWNMALEQYVSYYHQPEEGKEVDAEAAKAEAVAYYADHGISVDSIIEEDKKMLAFEKLYNYVGKDITVSLDQIESDYQARVSADKALYENDITAYVENNAQVRMMQMFEAQGMSMGAVGEYATYKPAGFRRVKHILLPVDKALLQTYTDLLARWEEQQNNLAVEAEKEETTEEVAEEAVVPVTEQDISNAKAAIFESLADVIDEVNQKIAEGEDFDALIATYGTDPGMTQEPGKSVGYEVSEASGLEYVQEFVDASMSIDEVGGTSAPYLSSFGVHIVKYIGDAPAGPIEMTEEEKFMKQQEMISVAQKTAFDDAVATWMNEANISYAGVVISSEELMEQMGAQ